MTKNEVILQERHQAAHPTILVVAHDPKFLKVLDMSLKLEFECVILSITGGRSAVETAKRIKPESPACARTPPLKQQRSRDQTACDECLPNCGQ